MYFGRRCSLQACKGFPYSREGLRCGGAAILAWELDLRQARARQCRASGLDDLVSDREANQLAHAAEPELPHQAVPVGLDGLDADSEGGRCVLVGLAFGKHLDHLTLALGQVGTWPRGEWRS